MDKRNRIIKIFAAPFITVLIMLILYAVKGITPFGSGNILGGDLYQQGVFDFFYVYDSIRSGSFFYDFLTAGGFARGILTCIFIPHYWPLAFIPRSSILVYISLLVIIKLAVIALSASYSFSKLFEKLSTEWTTAVALLYTFSGYNVQYFTNLGWLDVVALYPLLILSLKKMFDGKSKPPYVLILTYLLTINTYMAFFVVVSLIIFGGLYIFTADSLEKRKEHVYALGAGTVIPLAASLTNILGFFSSVTSTTRFVEYSAQEPETTGAFGKIFSILNGGLYLDLLSTLMFLGTELAIACILILLIYSLRHKEERKAAVFFAVSFVFFILQALILGTELVWHGGSRILFPFRNGFMVSFMAAFTICYYASTIMPSVDKAVLRRKQYNIIAPLTFALPLAGVGILFGKYLKLISIYNVSTTDTEQDKYTVTVLVIIVLIAVSCLGALLLRSKRIKNAIIFLLVTVIAAGNAFSFIGNTENSIAAQDYNRYYSDCEEVKELFSGDGNMLTRVSNPDLSLITNYPYYTRTPAVSNWTHSLSDRQRKAFETLGFATVYTRFLDSGGTEFSKAVVGTQYSVAKKKLNPEFYKELCKSKSGFVKYKNLVSFPVGVFYTDNLSDIVYENYENTFEYQNALFERLAKDRLFEKAEISESGKKETDFRRFCKENDIPENSIKQIDKELKTLTTGSVSIKTNKNSTLYIRVKNDNTTLYNSRIDGKAVVVLKNAESAYHLTNTIYPTGYNNNIYELGTFNGESITFDYGIANGGISDFDFYLMDNSKLESYCKSLKSTDCTTGNDYIRINAQYDFDGYIFIPLSYSKDWSCSVNGKAVETEKVIGNFTQIPVESGNNSIELKYPRNPAYMLVLKILIAFAAAIILIFIEKRFRVKPKWLYNFLFVAFMILFSAAISVIYVVPTVFAIIFI